VGGNSSFQVKIRHFSESVAIRLRSAARIAVRRRRTNKLEGEEEDTPGVNHGARRLRVQGAGSKPRFRLSREETGQYIARTAITPRREAAAPAAAEAEIAGGVVVIDDPPGLLFSPLKPMRV
jgi:hypothetical protein